MFSAMLVSVAQAQLDGLPQFDTYHSVVPFVSSPGGINTAEVLVHSFDNQELPSLVFLQTLDSNAYVVHQSAPFEWSPFQFPSLPMLDYRNVEVWEGGDSLSGNQWFFLAIDPTPTDHSVVVSTSDLLGDSSPQVVLESDIEFSNIHVVDMDFDGTPELLTVKYGNNIPILLWDMMEDGFVLTDTIGYSNYSSQLTSADLNGDSLLDIVTAGSPARIHVSQPDGSWNLSFYAPGLRDTEIADFNGDGHLDFAAIDYYGLTWTLAFNDGSGNFEGSSAMPFPFSGELYGHSVDAADLNQDGAMDLLFTKATSDSVFVWRNGIDDMAEWVPVKPVADLGERDISVVDLDGDGDMDWVGGGAYLHVGVHENHVNPGCTNEEACNYNDMALTDDGSCEFAEDYYDCNGDCLTDADGDGVCDELEVEGCTNSTACNYDLDSTEDNGTCEFPGDPCDDGDESTSNDVINDACECEGTPADFVQESDDHVHLFPNPAHDFLRIGISEGEWTELTIYDLTGQMVKKQLVNSSSILDVRSMTEGVYMVVLKGSTRHMGTHKLLVQH